MKTRLVVFYGNCQAKALGGLYRQYIAPLRNEKVSLVDKIKSRGRGLREADVLFEQIFSATEQDASRELQDSAIHIKFPHVAGMFLWPFAGDAHPRNHEDAKNLLRPSGPYDAEIGDRFLNTLIKQDVSPKDAIQAYYDLDIATRVRLERLFEIHLEQQRAKDLATGIDIADIINSRFRKEKLFTTRGHLTAPLFREMAMAVLPRAGVDPGIVAQAVENLESAPFPDTEAPLHPGVIDYFGLAFAADETRYNFWPLGFISRDEWWHRYLTYDWNRKLHDGLLASRRGKSPLALGLITEGLSSSPGSSVGWRCQCRLLLQLDRIDEAEAAARRAMELDAGLPDGAAEYVFVMLRQNRLDEAEKMARAALERCPVHRRAHFALASVLMAQNRLDETIAIVEQLLRIAPGNAQAKQRLASLHSRQGRHDRARTLLRQAVAARPADASAIRELTNKLLDDGQAAEAEAVARESFEANRANSELALVFARVLFQTGKGEEAAELLRGVLRAGAERQGIHGLLADILVRFRELDQAIWHAEQEVRLSKDLELSHARLSRLLLQAGRCADAEAAARHGLERLSDSAKLKRLLGDALDRQKRYWEALKVFEDVANEGGGDTNLRERIAHLKARAA
jgi:tetratricopeptide (TPR) repeat protein